MRKEITLKLILLTIVVFITNCGSQTPFTRGAKSEQSVQNLEKKAVQTLSATDFDRYVLPVMVQSCTKCHDNPAPNFSSAVALVKMGKADESDLYLRAIGQNGHMAILDVDSQQARNLADWINTPTASNTEATAAPAPAPKPTPSPVTQPTETPANPPAPVADPVAPPVPVVDPENPEVPGEGPTPQDTCVVIAETSKKLCEIDFKNVVLPALIKSCDRCHDNPANDFATAITTIKPGFPLESDLYTRAIGKSHKKVWAVDSEQAKLLENWILGK